MALLSLTSSSALLERTAILRRPTIWAGVLYVLVALHFAIGYMHDESKPALILATLSALSPLFVYLALRVPLVFPFCAYILVLPFDSLSSLGSGGTLAKLLGVLAAGALFIRVVRRGQAVRPARAVAAWLILLGWMAVSMFWAIDIHDAVATFQMYASLIALFTLLSLTRVTRKEINCILGAIVTSGFISAGFDAYLYHSGQAMVSDRSGVSRVMISAGDSSIDPNAMAAALVLPSAIALYWLFNSRFPLLVIGMIPVLGVLLLGFAASGSRGGFIELGIVFAYLIVRSRHRLWLAGLMIAAVAVTLAVNPGLPARFAEAQQDGGAGRRDIWHVGLYAFRDYWLTGAGVGNFPYAFDREYINVYAQYVLGWHWPAHNVPLMIATELGVIGFGLFLFALVVQFRTLKGLALKDRSKFEFRLALEGAFLGVVVSGFSTSDLNAKYVWLAFSLMALYRGFLISEQPRAASAAPGHWGLKPWQRIMAPRVHGRVGTS